MSDNTDDEHPKEFAAKILGNNQVELSSKTTNTDPDMIEVKHYLCLRCHDIYE
jgi:hypothetical protein